MVEVSLLKIPNRAIYIQAFKHVINHKVSDLLDKDINDWSISLKSLIHNQKFRKFIEENAYKEYNRKINLIYSERILVKDINSVFNKYIGFYISTLNFGGFNNSSLYKFEDNKFVYTNCWKSAFNII